MASDTEHIVLGSGKAYIQEFTGALPTDNTTIETDANLLGYIQGGAQLEYKPKFYDAQDDLGVVKKTILTDEEVTFKTGVLTWNGKTLQRVCSTAVVIETTTLRTVKIGGLGRQDGKRYLIRFVHEDTTDGDIRVTIVGYNQSGFTLKFAKDKETVIDAEFTAQPMDSDGTLIIYEEEIKAAS